MKKRKFLSRRKLVAKPSCKRCPICNEVLERNNDGEHNVGWFTCNACGKDFDADLKDITN